MFKFPNGTNLSSEELPASELARNLCRIASFIQNTESDTTKFQKYHDWMGNDGLYFPKEEISIHELFEIVKSPQALLESMPGDENVFIGIAPNSQLWYLRFYLSWDEEGFDLIGRFDVTLPSGLLAIFRQCITMDVILHERDAKLYFENFH
jgi:hypothetical protein